MLEQVLQRVQLPNTFAFLAHRLSVTMNSVMSQEADAKEEFVRQGRKSREAVLRSAHVVVCTLSAAGGDLKAFCLGEQPVAVKSNGSVAFHPVMFSACIVDEAAQALESATLVPGSGCCLHRHVVSIDPLTRRLIPFSLLHWSVGKLVLVGDPQQLPSTVMSQVAQQRNLTQSLFERLQRSRAVPVQMLDVQYRMHQQARCISHTSIGKWQFGSFRECRPLYASANGGLPFAYMQICLFPSTQFYQGRLETAAEALQRPEPAYRSRRALGPLAFFDLTGSQETSHGGSHRNVAEAEARGLPLACALLDAMPTTDVPGPTCSSRCTWWAGSQRTLEHMLWQAVGPGLAQWKAVP